MSICKHWERSFLFNKNMIICHYMSFVTCKRICHLLLYVLIRVMYTKHQILYSIVIKADWRGKASLFFRSLSTKKRFWKRQKGPLRLLLLNSSSTIILNVLFSFRFKRNPILNCIFCFLYFVEIANLTVGYFDHSLENGIMLWCGKELLIMIKVRAL